jgi:hypothetical protein
VNGYQGVHGFTYFQLRAQHALVIYRYQCSSWRPHWWPSTSHHAALPTTNIHVWLSYQWHPSRRYTLHLDT